MANNLPIFGFQSLVAGLALLGIMALVARVKGRNISCANTYDF
jgi:hypothetical protein